MPSTEDILALAEALRNPGRLVVGPTDSLISGSYPFSGAGSGAIREVHIDPGRLETEIVHEGWGEVTEIVRHGNRMKLLFFLEGFQGPMLQYFAKTNTTGNGYANTYRMDGGEDSGSVAALPKTVFVPDDRGGRAVLFRRPLPTWQIANRVALSIADDSLWMLGLIPTRSSTDSSTKLPWQIGRLEDLVL